MRWRTKDKSKLGETRIVTRFLYTPTRLPVFGTNVTETRWLETVKVRQVYMKYVTELDGETLYWADTYFVE